MGKWRRRFIDSDLDGLHDSPRSGKPAAYNFHDTCKAILQILESPPPKGRATWDGNAVAAVLSISVHKVWRILRAEDICRQRQRSWCVSTDPEFASKATDIAGLYLNPPQNALVISADEKPSTQALERSKGYVRTENEKIVHGMNSTYKRHGTLNLFVVLEVATGAIHSRITDQKSRSYPIFRLIVRHTSSWTITAYTRRTINGWLHDPNVHFHFTPTSASWLNMMEIWFGILSRKAIKGAIFMHRDELAVAIEQCITVYNENAEPFVWRKREVKGSQLKNTLSHLCN